MGGKHYSGKVGNWLSCVFEIMRELCMYELCKHGYRCTLGSGN